MFRRFLTYCLLLLSVCTAMADGVDHLGSIREVMAADVDLTSVFHADYNGLLKVQGSLEMMGCGKIVVEDGGKLIVDGGTLSNVDIILTPGAFLQILNGGVIETINGFSAPIGATIDIEHGQIR